MKLQQKDIDFIYNVVRTASIVAIDNIIIEKDLVRAIDENKTVVLWQNENIPSMPFGSIGLNRISVFTARYDIARTQSNFVMEAVVDKDSSFARSLTMKAKGIKIDYRCANPTTINAPRQVNDVLKNRVKLNSEAVALLQKGLAAMGAETVSIISNDGVSFELVDVNNDVFKHTFADEPEPLTNDSDTKFAHRYPAKTLLALFKQNTEGTFDVGQKGILCVPVNNLNIYVLPQV